MRFSAIAAGMLLACTGCATQDQLRQTEAQQGQAVQALRAGTDRNESTLSELRAEIRRAQESVHGLEVALTEARVRADSAKVQADDSLAASREFLATLLVVREEQRRQLDESGVAFADLRRRAAEFESRLLAQQRLMDQGNAVFNDAWRRLIAVESGLQEADRRSVTLEAKAKTGRESDDVLGKQLVSLRKQLEETRAVISSEGLLQMMRGLEDVRRNSATLRGSIDELQKAQTDSAAQTKNFYLDLDTRIRLLKQPAPRQALQQDRAPAEQSSVVPVQDAGTGAAAQQVSQ